MVEYPKPQVVPGEDYTDFFVKSPIAYVVPVTRQQFESMKEMRAVFDEEMRQDLRAIASDL